MPHNLGGPSAFGCGGGSLAAGGALPTRGFPEHAPTGRPRGRSLLPTRLRSSPALGAGKVPQSRKCAESGVGSSGAAGAWSGVAAPADSRTFVAGHVAERQALGALEPPASVAAAVFSLTIADAFVRAGESPAPPLLAVPRRFICSFPNCGASYNKAWKLDAHLCKHTGEVKGPKAGTEGPGVQAQGLVTWPARWNPLAWVRSVAGLALQEVFVQLWYMDHRSESAMPYVREAAEG